MDNVPFEEFTQLSPQECADSFIGKATMARYAAILILVAQFIPQLTFVGLLAVSYFNLNVKKLDLLFQCAIGAGGSFTQEYYDSDFVYISNYLDGELSYHSWIINVPLIGNFLRLFSIYNMMNQLTVLSAMM